MIYFFCQRKLNSLDSAIPVLLEIHRATGRRIKFVSFDKPTVDVIRRNIVLHDAIMDIGELNYWGSGHVRGMAKLLCRLRAVLMLILVGVQALVGRAVFVHSRALNEWPLRFLFFLNPRRTYLFGSDSYGMTDLMHRLTFIAKNPRVVRRNLSAAAVVAYTEDWHWLEYARAHDIPQFLIGPPRSQKSFIGYVASKADAYIDAEQVRAGLQPGGDIIAYMLTYLGRIDYMADDQATTRLFRETIAILAEASKGLPVFLKPHPATDVAVIEAEVAKYPQAKFIISHLHPVVLAARAKVVIANHYSATLADSFLMNTPTIEYTEYSADALKLTGNGSMRPEFITHFVNADPAAFRAAIDACLTTPHRHAPEGQSKAIDALLDDVCLRLGVSRAA